jgi:hypothetical protein
MSYEGSSVQARARVPAWQQGEGDVDSAAAAIPAAGVVRAGVARARERRAAVREVLQLSGQPSPVDSADREADLAADAACRTSQWLAERQSIDGHWRGPLEGDTILESEYLLLLAWAGRLVGPVVEAAEIGRAHV